ncbi:MAG TPA: hypothetical protein VKF32_04445, partial [Thermoanaerobaculia bacterium]|nr:hypothetical protein [Thermoanaerobaculia bacterium]
MGRRAFRGGSAVETMSAILREDPLPSGGTFSASPALERLLRRCLEKEPDQRFGSARDLAFALEALAGGSPKELEKPSAERRRSVAVLPFRPLSRDPETAHLGLGLADATITELALFRSLVARPTSAILKYEDRPVDPREAGRELGVDAIVDGTFQRAGSRLRVTVQLVDVEDGRPLWGQKIDSALDDVFRMQDEVSRKVAEALEVELTPSDERRLVRAARPAGAAHELWVKGRVHLLRDTIEDVNAAIDLFEKARDADPGLAVAWASLADSYVRLAFSFDPKGDWYPRAEEACARALAIDPSLPEARYVKARIAWSPHGGFQHATAIRELAAVLAERPSMIEACQRFSIVLLHTSMFDEGRRSIEDALAIDPADEISGEHLGFAAYLDTRFEEAVRITERSAELMPSPWAYHDVALALLQTGRSERALEVSESASRRFPGDALLHAARGLVAARRGDEARARKQLELVADHPDSFGHYHHTQHEVACIHALLGEADEAMRWLTDAARNGFPCHAFFERDPLLASLRPDPRFGALMAELRSECDGYRALYAELRGGRSGWSGGGVRDP